MNVIVYSADWCGPCKMLNQSLRREGIKYDKLNIDANLEQASKVGILSVPTTIITGDDGEEVARIVGAGSDVIKRIKEVLGMTGK